MKRAGDGVSGKWRPGIVAIAIAVIGCGRVGFSTGAPPSTDAGSSMDAQVAQPDAFAMDVGEGTDGAPSTIDAPSMVGDGGGDDAEVIDAAPLDVAAIDAQPTDGSASRLTIDRPTIYADLWTRFSPLTISGTCSTDVTTLSTSLGTLADADCTDGTWALMPFALALGSQVFTIMGRDALEGPVSDSMTVRYTTTPPPAPTFTSFSVPVGSDDNFPLVRGTPSNVTTRLYADPACTDLLGFGYLDFHAGGTRIAVDDNTTTALYATVADIAGNVSACTSLGVSYQEVTPHPTPTACDVMVSSNLTFAAFQAVLDAAHTARATHLAGDGHVTICLADGVVVSTSDAGEGGRIVVPGDTFYIHAPTGTATFRNLRASGALEDVGVFRVDADNVTFANLVMESSGPNHPALDVYGTIREIRGCAIRTSNSLADAVELWGGASVLSIEGSTIATSGSSSATFDGSGGVYIRRIVDCEVETLGSTSRCFTRQRGNFTDYTIGLIEGTELRTRGAGSLVIDISASMQFLAIRSSRFVRMAGAAAGASVIHARTGLDSYIQGFRSFFFTDRVRDNVFCNEVGAAPWAPLLLDEGLPVSEPTAPNAGDYDGPYGGKTFPWGDADDGAANPGHNLQTLWGGVCP